LWIPRTRKHLFVDIRFRTVKSLRAWKKMFPDPSTSPARYARALYIDCPQVARAADAKPAGWIRGFSRVIHLEVCTQEIFTGGLAVSFVPFHGLSPIVRSLHVNFPIPLSLQIINLILSFPLLEDLTVVTCRDASIDKGGDSDDVTQPSNPPMFTGCLKLLMEGGMKPITRRLLSLPGRLHFRRLTLTWFHEEDLSLTTALVECSRALQSLDITCGLYCMSVRHLRPH
jgi:hypothetical protein